jgi:signal peptidase I
LLDDKIMVDKLSIHWRAPARGEVVAFWLGERTFVKRVIAVGGDRVAVRGGVVFVNGTSAVRRPLGATTYRNRDEQSGRTSVERAFAYEERHAGRTYQVLGEPPDVGEDLMHDYPRTDLDARGCDSAWAAMYEERGTRVLTAGHDGTCVVPDGHLFMMGDNRSNSSDSRAWGAVPVEHVFGRVVGVWLGGPGRRFTRIGNVN